jgi:hypothetical protein
MWSITRRPPARQRREKSSGDSVGSLVETFDEAGSPAQREHTVTEAISSLGACIPSSLEVEPGRVVRITSVTDGVSLFWRGSIAASYVRRNCALGIEFIGERWPLERESSFLYHQPSLNISPQPSDSSSSKTISAIGSLLISLTRA